MRAGKLLEHTRGLSTTKQKVVGSSLWRGCSFFMPKILWIKKKEYLLWNDRILANPDSNSVVLEAINVIVLMTFLNSLPVPAMTKWSHVWTTFLNLRARTWATEPHRNYQLPSPAERNKLANDYFLRLWPDWQARVSFFPCWARWSRAEAADGRETSLRCVWASDRVTGIRHSDPAQKMINLKKMSSGGSMTIF